MAWGFFYYISVSPPERNESLNIPYLLIGVWRYHNPCYRTDSHKIASVTLFAHVATRLKLMETFRANMRIR